jgi:hypothetical protein
LGKEIEMKDYEQMPDMSHEELLKSPEHRAVIRKNIREVVEWAKDDYSNGYSAAAGMLQAHLAIAIDEIKGLKRKIKYLEKVNGKKINLLRA